MLLVLSNLSLPVAEWGPVDWLLAMVIMFAFIGWLDSSKEAREKRDRDIELIRRELELQRTRGKEAP